MAQAHGEDKPVRLAFSTASEYRRPSVVGKRFWVMGIDAFAVVRYHSYQVEHQTFKPAYGCLRVKPAPETPQRPVPSDLEVAGRLRSVGLKATPQRMQILRELLSRRDHPSAETLYKAVKEVHPTISFNTIYQTLQALAEKEVINVIRPVVDAARYDPVTELHGHFMCSQCKRIEDELLEDPNLKKIDSEVKGSGKYWVVQRQILWVGLCQACRDAASAGIHPDKRQD